MGKNTKHSPKNGFPINNIHNIKKKEIVKKGKTGQKRNSK